MDCIIHMYYNCFCKLMLIVLSQLMVSAIQKKWVLCKNFGMTFCRFAMGGIFTINVYAEHKTFGYHKSVCGALNRQFLVGAVMRSFFLPRSILCNIDKSVIFITICSTIPHKPKSPLPVFVNLKSQRTIISFFYSIFSEFLAT